MPCPKCLGSPAHSFEKVGDNLYYTKPANAKEDESVDDVDNFIQHFEDTQPYPWYWVFDCKDMKSRKFISNGSGLRMARIIQTERYSTLKGIFIIHPTTSINIFLGIAKHFLKEDMKSKIHVCSLGPIQLANKLQEIGSSAGDIQNVVRRIQQG